MLDAASSPAAPTAAVSAAAAATPPGQAERDGLGASPAQPSMTRLLHILAELREYQAQALREQSEVQLEHSEQNGRLLRLEQQLLAEEQIGLDLERRVQVLEDAIRQERLLSEKLSQGAGIRESVDAGLDRSSLSSEPKAAPEVLAAYLERLPKVRAQSCRETLRQRLQEARIDFQWPGEGGSSSSSAPANSGTGVAQDPASGHSLGGLYALPTYQHRWTMQAHLDGVRCVFLDDKSSLLITSGEDVVVKCWDLSGIWRMPDADELEPYAALRGHAAPVLALAFRTQDRMLFSAGLDCAIRGWVLPESGEGILRRGDLLGHTDAVWSLQHHAYLPYLASASSDGLVGLWNAEGEVLGRGGCRMQASLVLRQPGVPEELDVPTTVCWVPADTARLLAGYTSSRIALFDVRKGTQVLDLMPQGDNRGGSSASAAVTSSCARNFGQLMATGHVDCRARLLDLASGRCVAELTDHPDVVTSVSLDFAEAQLVTGCHDGCLRTFDLRMLRCCQQLQLHELKYDEGLHCIHASPRLLVSGGADGNTNILIRAP